LCIQKKKNEFLKNNKKATKKQREQALNQKINTFINTYNNCAFLAFCKFIFSD